MGQIGCAFFEEHACGLLMGVDLKSFVMGLLREYRCGKLVPKVRIGWTCGQNRCILKTQTFRASNRSLAPTQLTEWAIDLWLMSKFEESKEICDC